MERTCTRCAATHPATLEFFHANRRSKAGLRATCKPCTRLMIHRSEEKAGLRYQAKRREWQRRNPSRRAAASAKYYLTPEGRRRMMHRRLLHRYGITVEDYERRLQEQNGVCGLCRLPEMAKGRSGSVKLLSVDHCHRTGKVRALLCSSCNTGLGSFRDDPATLTAAIQYLKVHADNPER